MQITEYKRIEEMENVHFWYRAMDNLILEFVKKNVKKNSIILDAGCGTGGLAKKLEKFGEVIALDISPVALDYAKQKGLKTIKGSVENLPFKDNYFDCVLSLDVLYHKRVQDDEKALRQIYRILKKNGIFILRLPAFEFLRGSHDKVVETRHRYTLGEVKKKMKTAGFEVKKLTYANMILSAPLFIKRSFERIFLQDKSLSDSVILPTFVNEIFYRILYTENVFIHEINFPFGSSVISLAKK